MQFEVDNICDVCGRFGHVAIRQRVDPYTIVICHACRTMGATDPAAVAAEYRSAREQADAKIARHRRFAALPGPGRYNVLLPRSPALPAICCGCMGPPDERVRVSPSDEKPPITPRAILIAVAVIVFALVVLPNIAKVLVLLVGVYLAYRKYSSAPPSVPLLHVPICRRCDQARSPGRPIVEVEFAVGPFLTASFESWEYTQLLRDTNPQPGVSTTRTRE